MLDRQPEGGDDDKVQEDLYSPSALRSLLFPSLYLLLCFLAQFEGWGPMPFLLGWQSAFTDSGWSYFRDPETRRPQNMSRFLLSSLDEGCGNIMLKRNMKYLRPALLSTWTVHLTLSQPEIWKSGLIQRVNLDLIISLKYFATQFFCPTNFPALFKVGFG